MTDNGAHGHREDETFARLSGALARVAERAVAATDAPERERATAARAHVLRAILERATRRLTESADGAEREHILRSAAATLDTLTQRVEAEFWFACAAQPPERLEATILREGGS